MDVINETKCSFDILAITNGAVNVDRNSLIDFLKRNYFRDEPMNKSIGLFNERGSVIRLEDFCDGYFYNGE